MTPLVRIPKGPVRGAVVFTLIAINTLLCGTPLLVVAAAKVVVPLKGWRHRATAWLNAIAEQWVANNSFILRATQAIRWDIHGNEGLHPDHWYLVIANHRSWVDIFALGEALNRRIPFLKFFLKQELIWVPVMGLAWWSLDYPFMKRYSRDYLQRHPEKKGRDLEMTRAACEKFRTMPTSILIFVEGTRFTADKHVATGSRYRYLLSPRAGGVAYVLESMSRCLRELLDVTIVYPEGGGGFWDLCCGRIRAISVDVRQRSIETRFTEGHYADDPVFREHFQQWLTELWREKDERIGQILTSRDAEVTRGAQ